MADHAGYRQDPKNGRVKSQQCELACKEPRHFPAKEDRPVPKISVIMPVYNTAAYLPRTLSSVLGQSFRDIELICINDGSTDTSFDILQEKALADTRLKIINFEKNQGYSAAINAGILAATGHTLGFVDSDDYLEWDFYELLWKRYSQSDSDIVKGACILHNIDQSKRIMGNDWLKQSPSLFHSPWVTAIYRARLVHENGLLLSTTMRSGQDSSFVMKLMSLEARIAFVDETFYHYVKRMGSMSQSKDNDFYLYWSLMGLKDWLEFLHLSANVESEEISAEKLVRFLHGYINWFLRLDSPVKPETMVLLEKIIREYSGALRPHLPHCLVNSMDSTTPLHLWFKELNKLANSSRRASISATLRHNIKERCKK